MLDAGTGETTEEYMAIKDQIVASLRQEIIDGDLVPGQKVSESKLAARYGVSRTPVREAIKQLEIENLVTVERRRGTFVKRLSIRDVMDLYEVREGLEMIAAKLCAQRADNRIISELDVVLDDMESLVRAGDREQYLERDRALHTLIFDGANNPRLVDHYQLLTNHIARDVLGTIVTGVEGRMARSLAEHRKIVQAITLRDGASAERHMREHVQTGRDELAASMG